MSWTTADDLRAQLGRLWVRGELLRAAAGEGPTFPLRLTLKTPSARELADRFDAVRSWIAVLSGLDRVRLEWREVRHRVLGGQRVPAAAWIDTLDDALILLSKRREGARFSALLETTRAREPALVPWLLLSPLRALEHEGEWDRLLAVVGWLREHPRPGVYLRQVDLPGVDSKFLEARRGLLAEWLDLALSPEAVDAERQGTAQFAARYGFRQKPVRLRFRLLDERLPLLSGPRLPDVTLDAESFATLDLAVRRIFVTENETNFLAFPPVPEAIVLFGAGYGWEALARARWLEGVSLHYWGDIDTHGFAILDRLRSRFAHVESFLMDRETLLEHQDFWGEEAEPATADLRRLTPEEKALYEDLREGRIRLGLRLEQERVRFGWVERALGKILARSCQRQRSCT